MPDDDAPLHRNVRGLAVSATMGIAEQSRELRRRGRDVARLGLGQSPFPVPEGVVDALRLNAACKDYLPVRGLPELRDAVAEYVHKRHGMAATADNVLVGPGSKELMFLLQVVYDGELIIPSPAWVSYAPQAQIVGRPVRRIDTRADQGWRVDPAELDAMCRDAPRVPRILVLNYPGNPTGTTYTAEHLEAIAEVAARRGFFVLSDEIYGELHHEGRHVSIGRWLPERTILSTGLSKWCGAGGWRLGAFVFPERAAWLSAAMAVVASETFTSTSAPIQHAAVVAFRGGLPIERYLWRARRILGALGQELHRRIEAVGVRTAVPEGGFYLFPDASPLREALAARGVRTSDDLARRLLEEAGVAVLPGSAFGRPREELTFRIAYVDFDGARALAGLETLPPDAPVDGAFLAGTCGGLLAAVDRMTTWLAASA